MRRLFCGTVLLVVLGVAPGALASDVIHHELEVLLDPGEHAIEVSDRLYLRDGLPADVDGGYPFVIHGGLEPRVLTRHWTLERIEGPVDASFLGINATTETVAEGVPLEGWRLVPGRRAGKTVDLRYGGPVHHALDQQGEEYQRSFSETPGIVDERGVFLAGASFWVPTFGDTLVTFRQRVEVVGEGWEVVSQGRRALDARGGIVWETDAPQEEIYLVAGPLVRTCRRFDEVEVCALLRSEDPALAGRYLTATRRYLAMYEGLLPAYPYPSFALVENFWETGYGMPGFTLLGPKVIRFPWILTSSYPHELLHNWWGNSVYVAQDGGNWCEGLTSYLADHMLAEQRGEGEIYRRTTLKKFTDFVHGEDDRPLTTFRSRTSAASEALGYGKAAMVFHMVRRDMGDEAFAWGLKHFHMTHAFDRAGWTDLGRALDNAGMSRGSLAHPTLFWGQAQDGESAGRWGTFLETWTTRPGAPELRLDQVSVQRQPAGDWRLELEVRQIQEAEPFPLTVPVAVTVEGSEEPLWLELPALDRVHRIDATLPDRPLRVDVDPAFDLMRRLDPREVPPSLSSISGAGSPLFVLPGDASAEELEAWRALASAWARPEEPRTALDSELEQLPEEATWVLGWSNRHGPEVEALLAGHGVSRDGETLDLAGRSVNPTGDSMVLVARGVDNPGVALAWVTAGPAAAIPGLARKLPHYGKYSYLVFDGEEPTNQLKGQWEPVGSPLVRMLDPEHPVELRLPPREPLVALPPAYDAASLGLTIAGLVADDTVGRGLGSEGLEVATARVEARMEEVGLGPAGDDGYRQSFPWTGGEPEREMELTNLLGRVPGTDPTLADQPVIVLAHLDHLGVGWPDVRSGNEGQVHPGADDNASGVAALLELARSTAEAPGRRPVLFAVVTGEEAGRIGSKHLLEGLTGTPIACVNLDSVGRLGEGKLLVLDSASAREWRFIFIGVEHTTGLPVALSTEPLDASDQASCLERGIPAIQLTTGPHADYHRPTDTADRLDLAGLARIVEGAGEVVAYLADRTAPLTTGDGGGGGHPGGGHPGGGHSSGSHPGDSGGGPPGGSGGGHPGSERKVSLGTVPDFAFSGPGVRVQEVLAGSPAEAAGIEAGDVLLAVDDRDLVGLKDLAAALAGHEPGDEVVVRVLREGDELERVAVLVAR